MTARPDDAPTSLLTRLANYEVIAEIAEGGMAVVYAGRATESGRPVALKVIRPQHYRDKAFLAMFLDEARIAQSLDHPNIVRVLEFGHDKGRHFLAMELLFGQTLSAIQAACRARRARLPFDLVAWIGARVADALDYAHELKDEEGNPRQVVHRDVNPVNVVVTYAGEPKVIDFGLARAANRVASTAAGVVKGKLAYLAPEQAQGAPIDRRADIFALGVTLWELSLGRRLFRDESDLETIRRVILGDVPDPRTLEATFPEALATVLLHALAREPGRRYATAGEFAKDLDACARALGATPPQRKLAAVMTTLFPANRPRAEWERALAAASEPTRPHGRIQAWDEEAKKLTWLHASVVGEEGGAETPDPRDGAANEEDLARVLRERLLHPSLATDPVGRARLHTELALLDGLRATGTLAAGHARNALQALPTSPVAHALLRLAARFKGDLTTELAHLDGALEGATAMDERASLLADRARAFMRRGDAPSAVRAAWSQASEAAEAHPAILKGLEAAFAREGDPAQRTSLAEHLAREAEAFRGEPALAAWMLVERALTMTVTLAGAGAADDAGARGALARARALDPSVGPVREVLVREAEARGDAHALVDLLAEEARLERSPARSAQLELEAALLARHRLRDHELALGLLVRAASREQARASVQRRVCEERVEIYEAKARWAEARAARRSKAFSAASIDERAYEFAQMATLAERAGDPEAALSDVIAARALVPLDHALLLRHDALLGLQRDAAACAAMWAVEGARSGSTSLRLSALKKAAAYAVRAGAKDEAIRHLRAALAVAPGDAEAVFAFGELVVAPLPEPLRAPLHERIAALEHAAAHAVDPARKVAHLERVALLREELGFDPKLAANAYRAVLSVEPERRSALLGLARTAAREGDALAEAQALELEARALDASGSHEEADDTRVRAASRLPSREVERARALVAEVLARSPLHEAAQALETRLHANAGRWEQLDHALGGRLEREGDAARKAATLAFRAEIQRARLQAPAEALASLRALHTLDPSHPAKEQIPPLLELALGPAARRAALLELAAEETAPVERAAWLARVADLDEWALGDDDAAIESLTAALEATPDDDSWLGERLGRAVARRARRLALGLRASDAPAEAPEAALRRAVRSPFAEALTAIDLGHKGRARALLEGLVEDRPRSAPALRLLEQLARADLDAASAKGAPADPSPLAAVLAKQVRAFDDPTSILAAAWGRVDLLEGRSGAATASSPKVGSPPAKGPTKAPLVSLYEDLLTHAPKDRAALSGLLRSAVLERLTTKGDVAAPPALLDDPAVRALDALLELEKDPSTRLAYRLSLALLLDARVEGPAEVTRATLSHYREALRLDRGSVLAAYGTARLASLVGDSEASVAAAVARAALAPDPQGRAALLLQAASQLVSSEDRRLGDRSARLERAATLLEEALDADPESVAALGILTTLRTDDGKRDRLKQTLRAALGRATSAEAVLGIGTELSRLARLPPEDPALVLDALLRVRGVAPDHVPALLGLADHYITQHAWAEAAEALATVAPLARDARTRRAALLQLAGIHERQLARPEGAEAALRQVLETEPGDLRALRPLARLLKASVPGERKPAARERQARLARVLASLGEFEEGLTEQAAAYAELALVRAALGDDAEAARARIEALARMPTEDGLDAFEASFGAAATSPAEATSDPCGDALAAVAERADALGHGAPRARVRLASRHLARRGGEDAAVREARAALQSAPSDPEARAILGRALEAAGTHEEALETLAPLLAEGAGRLPARGALPLLQAFERARAATGHDDEAQGPRALLAYVDGTPTGADAPASRAPRHREPSLVDVARRALASAPLDAPTLRLHVVPTGTDPTLLDLLAAVAGLELRVFGADPSELAAATRQNMRALEGAPHPLRVSFDRATRAFGLEHVDLVVVDGAGPVRAIPQSVPWVLAHAHLATQRPAVQVAAFARVLTRVSMGASFRDRLPAPHLFALLVAAARVAVPTYGREVPAGALEPGGVEYLRTVARAAGRRQKKLLAELAPRLAAARSPTVADVEALLEAVAHTEARGAFLATGDLGACLDDLRDASELGSPSIFGIQTGSATANDRLAALLNHPLSGDLIRFALSAKAGALRHRSGLLESA